MNQLITRMLARLKRRGLFAVIFGAFAASMHAGWNWLGFPSRAGLAQAPTVTRFLVIAAVAFLILMLFPKRFDDDLGL